MKVFHCLSGKIGTDGQKKARCLFALNSEPCNMRYTY